MRISVITPTFNAAKYIVECVENVAAQNVVGLEHLVVDGGSVDGTVEHLQALAQKHSHLTFVSEKDSGQSDAMNKGLKMATGDVVAILNVDDYYEPGAIGEALALLDDHPSTKMVVGVCRTINEDGLTEFWNRPADLRLEAMVLGWSYYQFPCNPSAYFYRKEVHEIVGYYNVNDHYSMDLEFILNCARDIKMSFFDRHWGNYRMIPGTKTFDNKANAAKRKNPIYGQFKSRLSPYQRFNMNLLKNKTHLKWAYWRIKDRLRSTK